MADPRFLLGVVQIACCYTLVRVIYTGRKTAAAALKDRARWYEDHKHSLCELLGAMLLFLVLVLLLVPSALPHGHSTLFWVHEVLDAVAVLLVLLAIIYNGNRSVWHKRFVYPATALAVPISILGNILFYQLRF